MDFPCSKCGLCCKLGPKQVDGWPQRADGACYFLNDDNTCRVYATRPGMCRIRESKPAGLSLKDWYSENAQACNRLIKDNGLGDEFLVTIYERT